MSSDEFQAESFSLKNCDLISIATGRKALTLSELRDHIRSVSIDSIYHHFWGGLMSARFEEREFNNDFAFWCRRHLHEPALAEKLAVIDPVGHLDLEALREEILENIEEKLDESESVRWLHATRPFEFIRSQLVIFDTGTQLSHPHELAEVMPDMPTGSIFYHFIDARRRLEGGENDFSYWLACFGEPYELMRQKLSEIDPFFSSLTQVRDELSRVCRESLKWGVL